MSDLVQAKTEAKKARMIINEEKRRIRALQFQVMPGLLGAQGCGTDLENTYAREKVAVGMWELATRIIRAKSTPKPRRKGKAIPMGVVPDDRGSGGDVEMAGVDRRSTVRPRIQPAPQIFAIMPDYRRGKEVEVASKSLVVDRRSSLRPRIEPAPQTFAIKPDYRRGKELEVASTSVVIDRRSTLRPRIEPGPQIFAIKPDYRRGKELEVASKILVVDRRSTLRPRRTAPQTFEKMLIDRGGSGKEVEVASKSLVVDRRSTLRPRTGQQIVKVLPGRGKEVQVASATSIIHRKANLRTRELQEIRKVRPVDGGIGKKDVVVIGSSTSGRNLRPRLMKVPVLLELKATNPSPQKEVKVCRKPAKTSTKSRKNGTVRSKILLPGSADTKEISKATSANKRKSTQLVKKAKIAKERNERYKAKELLNEAIVLNPSNCEAFLVRGDLSIQTGDSAQAVLDYFAIKSIDKAKFTPILVGKLKAAQFRRRMSAQTSTNYTLLDLRNDATDEEIRLRFVNLVRQVHSDKHYGASKEEKIELNAKFRSLLKAYETLRDPEKRAEYDFKLSQQTYLHHYSRRY